MFYKNKFFSVTSYLLPSRSFTPIELGFTLIELLVVMAILGILLASLFTLLNPLEQLAKARDAGKRSTVHDLGAALRSNHISNGSTVWMTPVSGAWITNLISAGEISVGPTAGVTTGYSCTGAPGSGVNSANQNNYCYKVSPNSNNVANTGHAIVYTVAESQSERARAGCTSTDTVYIVWSSADAGKTGTYCSSSSTSPSPGVLGSALK